MVPSFQHGLYRDGAPMIRNAITLISILDAAVLCALSAVAGYFGYDVTSIVASRIAMVMIGVLVVNVFVATVGDLMWYFNGNERRTRV